MRAREIVTINRIPQKVRIDEGGNAVPDVGAIHIDEIEPTLKKLADMLKMPEVLDQTLGSVGKAEYSGDIDIAVNIDTDALKELSHELRNMLGNQNVKGVAGNVAFAFPIENYDESKQGRQPRTGKVQIDLIPGDPTWMRTFMHSPGDASKLKGIHRNLAIHAVVSNIDTQNSEETDQWGRPLQSIRWLWGMKNGLVRVRKYSRKNERTGEWVKKQDQELLSEPLKDPAKIAEIIFKGKAGPEALDSVETIIEAVKKAYSKKEQDKIFGDIVKTFKTHWPEDTLRGFQLPKELKPYLK
jgi:hypothetical protein